GAADAEIGEVTHLQVLRVGVIEADEQYGDYPPARITYRGVLGHVEAVEEQRTTDIVLAAQQTLVGRMLMVEHGAERTRTVLLGQRGGDAHEILAITHEYRGDACGHAGEVVDLAEFVVEAGSAQVERRGLQAANGDTLVGTQLHAAAETLLEQPGQTLRAVAQAAVKGGELIGEQA